VGPTWQATINPACRLRVPPRPTKRFPNMGFFPRSSSDTSRSPARQGCSSVVQRCTCGTAAPGWARHPRSVGGARGRSQGGVHRRGLMFDTRPTRRASGEAGRQPGVTFRTRLYCCLVPRSHGWSRSCFTVVRRPPRGQNPDMVNAPRGGSRPSAIEAVVFASSGHSGPRMGVFGSIALIAERTPRGFDASHPGVRRTTYKFVPAAKRFPGVPPVRPAS